MKSKKGKRDPVGFIPTGSTLLNLACSDHAGAAFKPGTMINIVGDSAAGKSFLSMSILAEVAQKKAFSKYRLIYDDVESALFFDIPKLFGKTLAKRIEGPGGNVGEACSNFIEDFYYNLDDCLNGDQPFIYVLDSMDGLTSYSELDKFDKRKKAHRKGKEAPGIMTDGKAKVNSSNLRQAVRRLRDTKSLLVIVSQTRDNIGMGFSPKTHSGGNALTFYASHKMWLAVKGKIKKTVKKKPRTLGIDVRIRVTKNRITGRQMEVSFPIYYSYGIDDIASCCLFLQEEEFSVKKELEYKDKISRMPKWVEENQMEEKIRSSCQKVWDEIREATKMKRKPRYE